MIDKKDLYGWCKIKTDDLVNHKELKTPFRMVETSDEMGVLMAEELLDDIVLAGKEGRKFRAIIPCGPKCWYKPFTDIVNEKNISLRHVIVFHMDECLDWQGNELAKNDPYNFKTFMEEHFYAPVKPELCVLDENRHFLSPQNMFEIAKLISSEPVDYCLGGWGQDGHIAYNQTRRHPFSTITIEDLKNASVRIQDNNIDTIITLGQRSFGAAYQFVPPMSVTLGVRECMSAKKIRVFSDTGTWKQTALRVALFSGEDVEYPLTLLQSHKDAIITATRETANHPIADNPEWEFKGVNV